MMYTPSRRLLRACLSYNFLNKAANTHSAVYTLPLVQIYYSPKSAVQGLRWKRSSSCWRR